MKGYSFSFYVYSVIPDSYYYFSIINYLLYFYYFYLRKILKEEKKAWLVGKLEQYKMTKVAKKRNWEYNFMYTLSKFKWIA